MQVKVLLFYKQIILISLPYPIEVLQILKPEIITVRSFNLFAPKYRIIASPTIVLNPLWKESACDRA